MSLSPQLRLLAVLCCAAGVLNAPRQIGGDTWFNLVLGREIVWRGLIYDNQLTVEGLGKPWLDQQWLAHLIFYGLERGLGLQGLVLVGATISAAALLGAAIFAERQGASPGRCLLIGALSLASSTPQTLRAQSLAFPLCALCVGLLELDYRRRARRTWWLVPLCVLWANLHGSALLAPGFALLLAASRLLAGLRAREPLEWRGFGRDLSLAAALVAALGLTPYGLRAVDYYRSTLGNADFRRHIVEWSALSIKDEPATALLIAASVAIAVLSFRRASLFALSVCVALSLLTCLSARHASPLAIAAAALLPAPADLALRGQLRFHGDAALRRLGRWLLPLAGVAYVAGVPALVVHTLEHELTPAFTDRVAELARDADRILADEYHSDRVLWFHPELRGRLSHDVRIEVLSSEFLERLARAHGAPQSTSARRWLRGYDLVLVDRLAHASLYAALAGGPDFTLAARDGLGAAFVRRAASEGSL